MVDLISLFPVKSASCSPAVNLLKRSALLRLKSIESCLTTPPLRYLSVES